jgi:hypothetical protein
MESKNPLEEIREAILESRLFGIENEISQMGVSDELLSISDALDNYYGIKRKQEPDTVEMMGGTYRIKPSPYISSIVGNPWGEEKFSKTTALLEEVKTPLESMRKKLPDNDPIYLNLSSAIVSIALRNVVSSVNSYKKPAYHDYRRYDMISGVDKEFRNLVLGGLKVFNILSDFDMTKECLDNYETNRKAILSIAESIQEAMLHPSRNLQSKNSSSGCIVLALALSTSIVACLCGFIVMLS